ncbi:hypothetical protein [Streptomyces deccanensis]|uniref:hypothetical protein n=1 Tax=Streptomyces deccanensis TaxID=424188 RepID=UPI001EFB996B|nr:hypothetical protein [Streptomyces deccanensis]ULR51014.1 hypothetical protein L3078_17865 [Streptomyces deccanensis]
MKRSEYEALAAEFRSTLEAISQKPRDEQVWPEYEDWLSIPGTSTCTTPTCRAFGIPDPVTLHENADGIFRGQCGLCQEPITPVPVFEED